MVHLLRVVDCVKYFTDDGDEGDRSVVGGDVGYGVFRDGDYFCDF